MRHDRRSTADLNGYADRLALLSRAALWFCSGNGTNAVRAFQMKYGGLLWSMGFLGPADARRDCMSACQKLAATGFPSETGVVVAGDDP